MTALAPNVTVIIYSNGKEHQERENAPMDFKLRGKSLSVTRADVLRVTRDVPPAPVDGRKKYFVKLHGRNYPIKQVFQLFSNLPSAVFTSQDAHRILSRLGFDVTAANVPENGESTHRDDGGVRKLLVVFHSDEDGWEVASCPTLPGCHSQGRTREEALRNVREAIRGYLASLREHGAASPPSSEFQVIDVRV